MTQILEFSEINTKAVVKGHPSGKRIIAFSSFYPVPANLPAIEKIFSRALTISNTTAEMLGVYLEVTQQAERMCLEQAGFKVDGFTFSSPIDKLYKNIVTRQASLPPTMNVREMNFELDIESIVALEVEVHSHDQSSRVSFDTPQAIESMRAYYSRACERRSVFLLVEDHEIIGLLGLFPDKKHEDALHISSTAIRLNRQGERLFMPFLKQCLMRDEFIKFKNVMGVTTTERLLGAAEAYGFELLGWSLSKNL